VDIGFYSLEDCLLSIVNGWIYSITCKYALFDGILVYFCHICWIGIFVILGLIVACIYYLIL